ncbi:hypothetical protein GOV12_06065 [Candidatus Pacearchaeota archaeon]|nr:hypothetical protein [Candidatus Pacearchaeota archaeon]
MSLTEKLLWWEKKGYITRKPRSIYVFLLGFAYLLIWYFSFNYYIKFDLQSLNIWMIFLSILTFLTFIYAIIHLLILKKIGKLPPLPKFKDEEGEISNNNIPIKTIAE